MRRWIGRLIVLGVGLSLALVATLLGLKKRIPSRGDEASDALALATILDGLELRSRSEAFRGGSALTLAGGSMIDLREATLAPEGANLLLRTIMGGTSLVVPQGWRVEVAGTAFLGAVEDRTEETPEPLPGDAPRLRVSALAVLGGVEVTHEPRVDPAGLREQIAEARAEAEPEPAPESEPVVEPA